MRRKKDTPHGIYYQFCDISRNCDCVSQAARDLPPFAGAPERLDNPEDSNSGPHMTFWIITIAMSALVVVLLARALTRGQGIVVADPAEYDLKVYRDQLAEVERDVARGVIAAQDAERTKTEISRRILASDASRRDASGAKQASQPVVIAILAALLMGGSLAIYAWQGQPGYGDLALKDRKALAEQMRETRPKQQVVVDGLPPFVPAADISAETLTLMERLRETVSGRPNDLEGHTLLARYEASLGNFVAAAKAQEGVLRIKGADITAEDISEYGELLVFAAGLFVSPEAEVAFREALARDENDGRARYYVGLMMYQTGRPDISFRLWDALLRRGPADAPWIEPILAQIEEVAYLAGVNYTVPTIGAGAAPGPSIEDIEAASEMTPQERMEMIGGMIDGLSSRLATEGGPPQDWARLITSLAIMGNPDQSLAVFSNAMEVFADDAGALDIIRAAGSQAGVAE